MKLNHLILEEIKSFLNVWYHGSPDGRDLSKNGFEQRTASINYIENLDKYNSLQQQMNNAKNDDNKNLYFKLLDEIGEEQKRFKYNKPIFLSDKYDVAKTYANPNRAFDYQNAEENVFEVNVNPNLKTIKIIAIGDRFRFINPEKVVKGFMDSGVDEKIIRDTINKFNFHVNNNKGIQTDVIAAIAQYLNFDAVDVVGVLDSYHGGNVQSTVKMIFNVNDIKIK